MSAKPLILVFFAVSVACLLPNAAVAGDGPYCSWGGYGPWAYGPPGLYVLDSVPYYALHPPVYYSHPVRRTYGLLPYPYVPRQSRRIVPVQRPMTVLNPYVAEQDAVTMETGHESKGPLVVLNPYVAQPDDADTALAASLPPRVQVTYPARLFDQTK